MLSTHHDEVKLTDVNLMQLSNENVKPTDAYIIMILTELI